MTRRSISFFNTHSVSNAPYDNKLMNQIHSSCSNFKGKQDKIKNSSRIKLQTGIVTSIEKEVISRNLSAVSIRVDSPNRKNATNNFLIDKS
jgi:hypothetical protein